MAYLGSLECPIRSIHDLELAIRGRTNQTLYTVNMLDVPDSIYRELQARNIKLLGCRECARGGD